MEPRIKIFITAELGLGFGFLLGWIATGQGIGPIVSLEAVAFAAIIYRSAAR